MKVHKTDMFNNILLIEINNNMYTFEKAWYITKYPQSELHLHKYKQGFEKIGKLIENERGIIRLYKGQKDSVISYHEGLLPSGNIYTITGLT